MPFDLTKSIDMYIKQCSPVLMNLSCIKKFIEKFKEETTKIIDKSPEGISRIIDDLIRSNKGDKGKLVEFSAGFSVFIEKNEKIKLEISALSAEIIDNPTERRLHMACFLHEPKTVEEIIQHFFETDRTLRNDLAALREGFTFMGQKIQINAIRKNKKLYYVSTLHPVFLPLNLTEVFALTTGLLKIVPRENPIYDIYTYIAEFIYGQLSEYGRRIIHKSAVNSDVFLPDVDSEIKGSYRDERKLIVMREGAIAYMLKSGNDCFIEYEELGVKKEVQGRIRLEQPETIRITSKVGSFVIYISQVISVRPVKYY